MRFFFALLCLWATQTQAQIQISDMDPKNVSVEFSWMPNWAFGDIATIGDIEEISNQLSLFNAGASYQGMITSDSVIAEFDLDQPFGKNGWQGSTFSFVVGYGWGRKTNNSPQPWLASFSFSSGVYQQGKGMKLVYAQQRRLLGSNMGSTVSPSKFQWSVLLGGSIGFDSSFNRTADEVGIYHSIKDKFVRESEQHNFSLDTAYLYAHTVTEGLEKVLPSNMGGSPFFVMGTATGEAKYIVDDWLECNVQAQFGYDVLGQLTNVTGRAQHQLGASIGLKIYPWRLMSLD